MSGLFGLPVHIDARSPGGIVIRIYDDRDRMITQVLLGPHNSNDESDLAAAATAASDQATAAMDEGSAIRQAIYDGDSGDLCGVMIAGRVGIALVIDLGNVDDE